MATKKKTATKRKTSTKTSKNKREKTARNARIKKLARAGVPYSEIGKQFNISKKRAWEIVNA